MQRTAKSKAIPVQAYYRPIGFQEAEAPRYLDKWHMKIVRLPALRTGRLYSPGNIRGIHFCYWLIRPQGHSEAGRTMSTKNSSDPIGNRTRWTSVTVTKLNGVRGVAWSHTIALVIFNGFFLIHTKVYRMNEIRTAKFHGMNLRPNTTETNFTRIEVFCSKTSELRTPEGHKRLSECPPCVSTQ